MRNTPRSWLWASAICIVIISIGCKRKPSDVLAPEDDTRIWVQEAYAKMDYMVINSAFNRERLQLIKASYDQENDGLKKINLSLAYAQELLKCGDTQASIDMFRRILQYLADQQIEIDKNARRGIKSLIAIAYMRQGEIENCIQNHNHESCFLPIKGKGVHTSQEGSRAAIVEFEELLKEFPDDLESKYLLNLAYMTIGAYPEEVPPQWRIDPSWFTNDYSMTPFKDIAPELGLNRQNYAGGTVVDDFDNDGWLDIVVSSWGPREELVFYRNKGNGTFADETYKFNLKGHVGALNINQTDFNNDGWLDLYLMRGAWFLTEGDLPNTLLMNTGDGHFIDVTRQAGLTKRGPTQASSWVDCNMDGWLDLVVAYESLPEMERGIDLYINQQDGTFSLESTAYGLQMNQYFKGCVFTYANEDMWPDLYMSSQASPNMLYLHQGGSGTNKYTPAGEDAGVQLPFNSFPCWSFDYDNDGREDLFVSGYSWEGAPVEQWMLSKLGHPDPDKLPRLYHQIGNGRFEDVAAAMGLNEVAYTMGCNYGDINTDGYLDFYLSTGNPLFQSLAPNKMYLNMAGKRFEDVSYVGGFANIQKGHGVGFGDLDHDGDEDIYVVMGGAVDGDKFFNCLFENPNTENHHWVILKLKGETANAPAIGARVEISVEEAGAERKIYRVVSSGASFGGNSLALEVGLGNATRINYVKVKWPNPKKTEQVYTNLQPNKAYELRENKKTAKEMHYHPVSMGGQKSGSSHQHH